MLIEVRPNEPLLAHVKHQRPGQSRVSYTTGQMLLRVIRYVGLVAIPTLGAIFMYSRYGSAAAAVIVFVVSAGSCVALMVWLAGATVEEKFLDDARLVNLDVSGTKEWQTKLAAAVADQSGQYRWAPDELRDELLTAELRWRSTPNPPRDMDAERDAWVQKLTSN